MITVFGTRPEAIKMAPVVEALRADDMFDSKVLVTAQHREMLDQILDWFSITPDFDLNLMQPRQSLEDLTQRILLGCTSIFREEKPDLVLVHGDTTTTFAAALAAFYAGVTVGHVEAGLRSGNPRDPFPEEMNRRLTGAIAELHFSPTEQAKANLLREGVSADSIWLTGNTAIDALHATVKRDVRWSLPELPKLLAQPRRTLLAEIHRRENWGKPLYEVLEALRDVIRTREDTQLIFSVHRNPVVRDAVYELLDGEDRVHLLEPMDYVEWAHLMKHAYLIVTDSGGIQEEAPALGVPVMLLRRTTERPEAVAAGTVRRVDPEFGAAREALAELLDHQDQRDAMSGARNPFGDGRAAERIVDVIRYWMGISLSMPEQFQL